MGTPRPPLRAVRRLVTFGGFPFPVTFTPVLVPGLELPLLPALLLMQLGGARLFAAAAFGERHLPAVLVLLVATPGAPRPAVLGGSRPPRRVLGFLLLAGLIAFQRVAGAAVLVVPVPVQAVAALRPAALLGLPPVRLERRVVGEGVRVGADVVVLHQRLHRRAQRGGLGGRQPRVPGVLGLVPPVLGPRARTLPAVGAAAAGRRLPRSGSAPAALLLAPMSLGVGHSLPPGSQKGGELPGAPKRNPHPPPKAKPAPARAPLGGWGGQGRRPGLLLLLLSAPRRPPT